MWPPEAHQLTNHFTGPQGLWAKTKAVPAELWPLGMTPEVLSPGRRLPVEAGILPPGEETAS